MQPEWSTCYGDITGVYDPPIALQPASTVPGPQTPGGAYTIETKTATPASGPGLSVPSPTSPPTTESNAVVEVDSSQQTAEAVTNPYAEAGDDVHGSSADQTHGNDQEEPTAQDASKNAEADSGLSAETGDNVQGSSADQNYSTGGDDDIAQDPSQMSDANSGSSAEGNDDSAAGPVDPSENTTFSQDIAGTSSVLDGAATSTKKSAAPSVIADGGDGQTAGSDAVSADGEDYETSESNITSVVNADISSAKPATANNGQMTKVISADSSHTINSAEAANSGPSGYDAAGKQSITAESQQATDTAMLTHSFGPSAVVNTFAFGSKTLIVSPTDDRQEIVRLASATLTVSPRGPASTIDGLTVRAAVNGRLLVASEALTSTFTPASDPNAIRTTVTYSSQTLTINEQPNGVDVLENQSTTISLTPDGTAVMLGGLMVSEASNGALAYETSEPTTAAVMSGLSSPATSGHEGGVSATSALLSNTGPVSTFSLAAVAVVAALLSVMLIV
ncbi:hypothetical protein B0A50_00721 [Salinomyces thailandicus]|uniref:Uncharacterized protein n=1 Tax=Salinomyces thailandicus TaxID=706561 RepID=A0A4U0UCK7_9PEZI|nr:hypothetical protein B0A50_00721 [Salinomyces thailandica]